MKKLITIALVVLISTPSLSNNEETVAHFIAGSFIATTGLYCCCIGALSLLIAKKRKDIITTTAKSANPSVVVTNIHNQENFCAETIQNGCRTTTALCCIVGALALGLSAYYFALGQQSLEAETFA